LPAAVDFEKPWRHLQVWPPWFALDIGFDFAVAYQLKKPMNGCALLRFWEKLGRCLNLLLWESNFILLCDVFGDIWADLRFA